MEQTKINLENSMDRSCKAEVVAILLSLMEKDPRVMDIALLAIAGYLNGEQPWYPSDVIEDIIADLEYIKSIPESYSEVL